MKKYAAIAIFPSFFLAQFGRMISAVYRKSPGHEEKAKHIFRVPDLIVYDGDKEINRIVESPVLSLERDLLSITTGNQYQPNYKGGLYLATAMAQTTRLNLAKDSIGLLRQLKPITPNSSELNSLGYVWMTAGDTEKALLAFQLNELLFPADVNVYDSLGEISLKMGEKEKAKHYYQKLIAMQPGNENAAKILLQLN